MGTRYQSMRGVMKLGQRIVALFAIALLTVGLGSCAKPIEPTSLISEPTPQPNRLTGQMAEVSPPETLESLKQIIDAYTPQVRILSPRPGEVIDDTTATVRLQVRGLPLFKNDTYQLGPHLHLFLDGEPYQAIYDSSESITFEGLSPGTHTLRVFASRPWHESFKNQGAFDQRTFHIYAPTPQNEVNAKTPLLTYSRPQGSYGAEPIMLDFYLTNAPLHLSAQADPSDDLHDWRIRCTVNDQSFVFDQWQPIWLKGFKPGRNWVKLELIDESGNPIDNRFNNTVRAIDYQPGSSDALSRLVRGELTLQEVAGIIDPTYLPPTPEPEPDVINLPTDTPPASPDATAQPGKSETAPEPMRPQPKVETTRPPQDKAEDLAQPPALPKPSSSQPAEPRPEPSDLQTPESLTQPEASADEPQPNPFLLPEPSLTPSDDTKAPAAEAEKTLIEEIQEILDEARAEELTPNLEVPNPTDARGEIDLVTPAEPETPQRIAPAPATEASPDGGMEGLRNRFKQWRKEMTPEPDKPPVDRSVEPSPSTPDLFAAPQPPQDTHPQRSPSPAQEPEPAPSLPRVDVEEPYPLDSFLTSPRLALPKEETETTPPDPQAPVELPRLEPDRPSPRSPLAPEIRPFI